jgi:hypothetical protein
VLNHGQVDIHLLQFPRVEKVDVWNLNDSDLQFIITLLENSIPSSGRGFLKKLKFSYSSTVSILSSVIEVSN